MLWKSVALSFVLLTALATGVVASEFQFHGCTRDNYATVLDASFPDHTPPSVVSSVNQAFQDTAAELNAADLVEQPGFILFTSKLSDAAKAALVLHAAPVITSKSCN